MDNVSEIQDSLDLFVGIGTTVQHEFTWYTRLWQIFRFGIVGVLNTVIDVLVLNILLWRWPTHNTNLLLLFNSLAYIIGALNSFLLNKYWTFEQKQKTTRSELIRFILISIVGIICNDGLIWSSAKILHPLISNSLLWANASKAVAVVGTSIVSYIGMRFWVFANMSSNTSQESNTNSLASAPLTASKQDGDNQATTPAMQLKYSLSLIMPAHNEEAAIAETVRLVLDAATQWTQDFEVIVVNDGSKDGTQAILEQIAATDTRLRIIKHEVNQGYGAALVSGFEAVTKELAFFMDSDGQFDILDLERFFPFIEKYDAVLGYRINRQDTWMRKLNAWGWKMLVTRVFQLQVRDVDCAFKLYRSQFFREHRLETHGAMINTEILYKFARAGYTYTQLGVHHLPRRGGRATGAKPAVIIRAFSELFVYARKWHHEERLTQTAVAPKKIHTIS